MTIRTMDDKLQRANEILGTNYGGWRALSEHQYLSEDFIREFKDKVNWNCISTYQRLSENFIREFKNKVNWNCISNYQRLSEDFIREFKNDVSWGWVLISQHLSEDFIREFADKFNWRLIPKFQRLPEDFIRKFADSIDWDYVSRYQPLSEDFIREFANRVNWYYISMFQHLSNKFIGEFKDKLDMNFIADSWHYKSVEDKKKAVIDTGLYECHDDYFIAYKGIRGDRYSKFNFRYQYLKGHTYETWCDCSAEENSYGFSAWTEKKAREYCNELVVRVKVRYEDVGRVVHDGGKIRCFKIEILD